MASNITPEERLLKLIRGPKKKEPQAEKKPVTSAVSSELPVKKSLLPNHPIHIFIQKYFSLLNSQKIIWIVFVASCIYLIYSFIYPEIRLRKIKLPRVAEAKIPENRIDLQRQMKPYEFYLEASKKRQIFGGISGLENSISASAAESASIKDMNLVGILSGDTPQAIIEDKRAQKTYYVNKGQFVGDFQLEDIQEGKIILNNNGQRYELHI
jgi:type II secretory pathway component PulC